MHIEKDISSKSEKKCCVISISNSATDDAKNTSYWWDAIHDLGNKLMNFGYGQFAVTVTPESKSASIMVMCNGRPNAEESASLSESKIAKMVYDIQNDFDRLVTCKLDVL